MSPMSLTPGGGESKTTLWSIAELLVNDTVVPFATVRVVGWKTLDRMQSVLSGQVVSGGGGGGGGGGATTPPPPPLPPHALKIEKPTITAIEPIFLMSRSFATVSRGLTVKMMIARACR